MRISFWMLMAVVPVLAAADAKFTLYRAQDLKSKGAAMHAKINEKKVYSETLDKYPGHFTMLSHREGDGEAEVHAKVADIFIVQSGEATLEIGGTVENARETAPGETRGSGITGAESTLLGPGDIVHIAAGVPHRLRVKNGSQFTYFVIKVDQ